jgi:hypothetical protein
MDQIKIEKELSGKSILRGKEYDGSVYLFFTDNTFCRIIGCGWDEHDAKICDSDTYIELSIYDKYNLGIITKDELDKAIQEEKDREEQKKQKRKVDKEKEELETLKKLKAKYPNA